MPDKTDTLFDRYLSLGTSKDRRLEQARFPTAHLILNICHIMLQTSLFAVGSVLMALGLPLFFFLAISGWDLLGLFTHLQNLSARYLEADAVRRLMFISELKFMFFAASALVAALRIPGFIYNLIRDFTLEDEE